MSLELMGRKSGMTQIFDEKGNVLACTVIAIEPNAVVSTKTKENDGYTAVQLGFDKVKDKRLTKPLQGHFKKNGVEPRRFLKESRLEDVAEYASSQSVGVEYFENVKYIDVVGTSKGKGFQGVMKRHNFAGGPASHGSGFHRSGGSTGMRSTPGRCLSGTKKPGRMGGERCTVQNLKIMQIDVEKGLLIVQGPVAGCNGGLVYLSKAVKRG
jgi:large subunit ribosomal protein L3